MLGLGRFEARGSEGSSSDGPASVRCLFRRGGICSRVLDIEMMRR